MYNHYDDIGAYNSKESPYFSWYKFINWPDEYHSWWGIKLLPEVIEEDEGYRNYICGENGIDAEVLLCDIDVAINNGQKVFSALPDHLHAREEKVLYRRFG